MRKAADPCRRRSRTRARFISQRPAAAGLTVDEIPLGAVVHGIRAGRRDVHAPLRLGRVRHRRGKGQSEGQEGRDHLMRGYGRRPPPVIETGVDAGSDSEAHSRQVTAGALGRAQRGRRPRQAPRRLRRDQDHEARAGAHGRLGGRARQRHRLNRALRMGNEGDPARRAARRSGTGGGAEPRRRGGARRGARAGRGGARRGGGRGAETGAARFLGLALPDSHRGTRDGADRHRTRAGAGAGPGRRRDRAGHRGPRGGRRGAGRPRSRLPRNPRRRSIPSAPAPFSTRLSTLSGPRITVPSRAARRPAHPVGSWLGCPTRTSTT